MNEFGIVIVAYNPDVNDFVSKIKRFVKLTNNLVVINNGKEIQKVKALCKVINLGKNQGIAYAQNIGVEYLKKIGIEYVFFLDQDTLVEDDYFARMLSEWKRIYNDDPLIGALSPNVYDRNLKVELPTRKLSDKHVKRIWMSKVDVSVMHNTLPISSGLLTKVNIFEKVGGNVSWMFIDWVDFKFDIDLIKKGYSVYTTNNVTINHSVGKSTQRKFLWKTINVSNHAVFREYYFFRNGLFFANSEGSKFPQLRRYVQHALLVRTVFILYEKDRVKRIWNASKGLKDAILKNNS